MTVNPYQSPRPTPPERRQRTLQDGRWSLTLTGFFAGGYVGAWAGSLSGVGVGFMVAAAAGGETVALGNPALAFFETLVTKGFLIALLGTLTGGALGTLLGVLLASLVAIGHDGLRRGFVWLSCLAACLAATALAAALFRFDVGSHAWRPLAASQLELAARLAALGVVGLGGFLGGGLLGRILREVAWEPGIPADLAAEEATLGATEAP